MRPAIRYTPNQKKLFILLQIRPMKREQLLEFFDVSQQGLTAILRQPLDLGKIYLSGGFYKLYRPPNKGLTVMYTNPQPYSPPTKFEFMYLAGKLPKDF